MELLPRGLGSAEQLLWPVNNCSDTKFEPEAADPAVSLAHLPSLVQGSASQGGLRSETTQGKSMGNIPDQAPTNPSHTLGSLDVPSSVQQLFWTQTLSSCKSTNLCGASPGFWHSN